MPHELVRDMHMVSTALRYQCPCDGREIITINVMFSEHDFADEIYFLEAMRRARRDMITEIRQHTNQGKG